MSDDLKAAIERQREGVRKRNVMRDKWTAQADDAAAVFASRHLARADAILSASLDCVEALATAPKRCGRWGADSDCPDCKRDAGVVALLAAFVAAEGSER